MAFICAASISTAAVLSSGVRLSLSQPYALYVGQCSRNRHHTGCYRTSKAYNGGRKRRLCHIIFESGVAYVDCVHPPPPPPPPLYHHHTCMGKTLLPDLFVNVIGAENEPRIRPRWPEKNASSWNLFSRFLRGAACIDGQMEKKKDRPTHLSEALLKLYVPCSILSPLCGLIAQHWKRKIDSLHLKKEMSNI